MHELKDLVVEFISLVKSPANGKPLVLKGDGKPAEIRLAKMDDALMRAYGIVYAPDQVDSQGDFASRDTIRKAQGRFMRDLNLKNIDANHSFRTEQAFVAESWLIRGQDPLFPDEADGAWAVGVQINDADLWKQLKSGELTGLSLAGYARQEPSMGPQQKGDDEPPGWFSRLLQGFAKSQKDDQHLQEADMTKDEITALVDERVVAAVKAALAKQGPGTDEDDADEGESPDEVLKALNNAIDQAVARLDASLDGKIAQALGKGSTEDGGQGAQDVELRKEFASDAAYDAYRKAMGDGRVKLKSVSV